MLPTPEVGEHTIDHVNEDTSKNEDQSAAGIKINLLFSRRTIIGRIPDMGNDLVNNIVHRLPFTETPEEPGHRGNESQGENRIKPVIQILPVKEGRQQGDNIGNHFSSPILRQIKKSIHVQNK